MITPAGIKALAPGKTIHDDVVTGLSVRAFPSGAKAYYAWFRTKFGVARHPKIGDVDMMTIAEARAACKALMLKVANGEDPIGDRNAVKGEPLMSDLWEKFYTLRAKKKKSAGQDQLIWDNVLAAKWKHKRVRAVTYEDCATLHMSMKTTPYRANRVLALVSVMMNFAERPCKWRDQHTNPVRGIERYPEKRRRRFATGAELKVIGDELERAVADDPQSVAFIYLLLFTGARPGEIQTCQRTWLQPAADGGGVLRLPDSKTGQRDVYVPPQAMAVIKGLPVYGDGTLCGCAQPAYFWHLLRKRAGCPDLRMYPDLRRSFATVAFSHGESVDLVGGLLGHKMRQTTLIYARLMEDAASASAARTGSKMAQLLGGEE